MRLQSLEISNFRKFDHPVHLEGLGEGINVLAEPNEFGKSTVLAAIKAVLFERYRGKGRVGERMQHHRNANSPLLRLGFEVAGNAYHIEKRFMHREPYAQLTLPDGSKLNGDAAEEHLQSILGFAAPGVKGASADTLGVWGGLWVAQQDAARQPALSATGQATLHACLEAELGSMSGGDRSAALNHHIRDELFNLLDGNHRPKGRLKELGDQMTLAQSELVRLQHKRQDLDAAIGGLARLRRELGQASDAEADARLGSDLVDARSRRDTALRQRDVLEGAVTTLALAERQQQDAAGETQRRVTRREQIAAAERALSDANTSEARLLEAQVYADGLLTQQRDGVRLAETAAATAAQDLRVANSVVSLVMRSEQVVRLGAQLERAVTAQATVNTLTGELSANAADEARLQRVLSASTALARARSVLDAVATEVQVELEPHAGGLVQVSGGVLPIGRTVFRVVDEIAIDVVGVGRVQVRPAIRDRTMIDAEMVAAEGELRDALIAIGASDVPAAEAGGAARRRLAEQLKSAQADLKAATPGEAVVDLKPGLEPLRNHVEALRSRMATELKIRGLMALPTTVDAETMLQAANEADEAASNTAAAARAGLIGPEAERGRVATELGAVVLKASELRNALDAAKREQAVAEAAETASALEERFRAAVTHLAAQQTLVAQMQRGLSADTVEAMDARIRRLEEAIAARHATLRRLREEIVSLGAHIAHQEGEGLDEQIAAVERQRDDAAAEQGMLQRDAAVLTLLRDTLADAEREARERYVTPVLRRVTPYLQGLFPGVAVGLDEKLQITKLTREAGAEDIGQLSDGTVEQVAVLLRLAYADLLLERGKPALLILDDALAYSDRDRLETMFDVLTRAADRMQILVLTCRVDAFSRLGGNRVRLVSQ